MPCEQGDFGTIDIIEPDTDAAGHRQPCAIGRIGHYSVACTDVSLTKAGNGTFRQTQAGMVLSETVRHEQDTDQQQGDIKQIGLFHFQPFMFTSAISAQQKLPLTTTRTEFLCQ